MVSIDFCAGCADGVAACDQELDQVRDGVVTQRGKAWHAARTLADNAGDLLAIVE